MVPLLSLIIGALGAGLIYQGNQKREKILAETVTVVTAASKIESGEKLTAGKLSKVTIPLSFCPKGAVLNKNMTALISQRTLLSIDEGQILLWNYINTDPAEYGLSSRLDDGERAMTISVDDRTGINGSLKNGNRVDILATFTSIDDGKKRITRTLLQNVTILSLGINRETNTYATVTLKLTPRETELLTFAESMAELRLVLRGNKDYDIVNELLPIDFSNLKEVQKATKEESIKRKNPRIIYD